MPNDFPVRDLGAVGNVARGSKSGAEQELREFSVKRGDNGGVIVCESYRSKAPAGRRQSASFPGGGDYKENPFSPDDGAAAAAHVTGLMGQMGVSGPAPAAAIGPARAAVRGPMGGGAVAGPSMAAMRGPSGPPPMDEGY
jgi:hypothetical protein